METIPVVYSADDNFAMPLAVSIFTLVRNLSPDRHIKIYVVDGGITERSKQKIVGVAQRANQERNKTQTDNADEAEVSLQWVKPDMQGWFGQTLRGKGDLNEMTFYRLAMPQFLPGETMKALYVDADFFFKDDASLIFDQIPSHKAIAAVPDYSFPTHGRRYTDQPEAQQDLGFSPGDRYFNAGFLGINIDYWRSNDIAGDVITFLSEYDKYAWLCDQDAMNYALRGNWHALDECWNFHPTCRDLLNRRGWSVEERFGIGFDELQAKAKAVHFTGKKPWDQGYTNPERPFFDKELKASRWFTWYAYLKWRSNWWLGVVRRRFAAQMRQFQRSGRPA